MIRWEDMFRGPRDWFKCLRCGENCSKLYDTTSWPYRICKECKEEETKKKE